MSNKGLYRTGLVFALLTALSWVLFVIGSLAQTRGGELGPVEAYLEAANSTGLLLYTWGGILGSILVIPVFLAFFQGFRHDTGSVLIVPVTLAIVGIVFLTLGFMVDTGSMIYQFNPLVSEASGQEAVQLVTAAQLAQDSIEVTWAIGSFLGYGGSIVWMAILFFRSSRVPRWLNWAGIVGGLAGFVWMVRFIPIPAPQSAAIVFILLNIVLGMVWLIGLSVVLDRGTDGGQAE